MKGNNRTRDYSYDPTNRAPQSDNTYRSSNQSYGLFNGATSNNPISQSINSNPYSGGGSVNSYQKNNTYEDMPPSSSGGGFGNDFSNPYQTNNYNQPISRGNKEVNLGMDLHGGGPAPVNNIIHGKRVEHRGTENFGGDDRNNCIKVKTLKKTQFFLFKRNERFNFLNF